MAAFIATQSDVDAIKKRLSRYGISLSDNQLISKGARDDDFAPRVSRQTLRLFLAIYGLTNLYENLAIGILRRKKLALFVKDLLSRSSAGFAAFVALYSLVYRLAQTALRSSLPAFADSFRDKRHDIIDYRPLPGLGRPHLRATLLRLLRSASLPAFLAGLIASPTLLLDGSPERRTTVALMAVSRAVQGSWVTASETGWVPKRLRRNSWYWGPHILFALSNAQLLHAFVFDPDCFPESYSRFIYRFSDAYVPKRPAGLPQASPWPSPRELVDFIADSAKSKTPYPRYESPLLLPSATFSPHGAIGTVKPVLDLSHPLHTRLVCATLHPDEPRCSRVASGFVRREFGRATRFFAILSVLRMALSYRKTAADPLAALLRAAKFSVGSGAGVAGCIGAAWASICFFQEWLPGRVLPTRRFYLHGFVAGLFILLSPARSADLGLYSGRLALHSAWQVAVKRRLVRNVTNGEVIPFAVASATVMALFDQGSESAVTGLTRRLLKAVGGEHQ